MAGIASDFQIYDRVTGQVTRSVTSRPYGGRRLVNGHYFAFWRQSFTERTIQFPMIPRGTGIRRGNRSRAG